MKYQSPLALVIGAVPGAMPPLMGWTAITGNLDGGLILFGILLVWQIPHFIAIAIYRKKEYARAGIKVVSVVRGNTVAKVQAVAGQPSSPREPRPHLHGGHGDGLRHRGGAARRSSWSGA